MSETIDGNATDDPFEIEIPPKLCQFCGEPIKPTQVYERCREYFRVLVKHDWYIENKGWGCNAVMCSKECREAHEITVHLTQGLTHDIPSRFA